MYNICYPLPIYSQDEWYFEQIRGSIYLSGPISHYDLAERQEYFRSVERLLRDAGISCFNPFNNGVSQDASTRYHMAADYKQLLLCSAILLLPEWNKSPGCLNELQIACSCGMKILFWSPEKYTDPEDK